MPPELSIACQRLHPETDADIALPQYMTPHSSGMDVRAAVTEPLIIQPGDIALIPTGFAIALPEGYEAQIRPRSGLAVKYGIGIINSPGTIDADYRGEIKIALINHGKKDFTVSRGDRIAQMVVHQVCQVRLTEKAHLSSSDREAGGFGHTGV